MKHPRMTRIFLDAIWKDSGPGFYVEIGAWNGHKKNSTIILEQLGWDGVCIEPTPESYQELIQHRKCRCLNVAVFNKNGHAEFATFPSDSAQNGLTETHQRKHRGRYESREAKFITVETRTWDKLELPKKIDYLQIDTEGSELAILDCVDWKNQYIKYICIEDNGFTEDRDFTYMDYMLKLGYIPVLLQGADWLFYKDL